MTEEKLKIMDRDLPYKTRPGKGGSGDMAYIDARLVMDVLDKVVGKGNWQCDYKELAGKVYCGIGIYCGDGVEEKQQWIWKWDVGTESNFDKEKGEASDAFKRAAVKWGIGRFLYKL